MNKWASTDHTTRLSLLKEEVANSVLTFAEIVTDYFIRQGNFTIFPSYCSRSEVLLKVSYDNKVAELYITDKPFYHINYLLYEKYGKFEQDSGIYIEHLPEIADWLKQPPSWVTLSKELQDKEECKFGDYRWGGYPIELSKAVKNVQYVTKHNTIIKGNQAQFFKSPQEARDFYWELVEWLNN